MNSYPSRIGALALLCCTAATAAPPASDHGVVAYLAVAKVAQKDDGRHSFQPVRNTTPGDVIEYRITYRNTNYTPARGVVGTLAIPVNRFTYVAESATHGMMLEASLDGRTFEPVPLKRLVARDDGQLQMEPVPASEYRYLRWQLGDMPARGSVTMSARMRVNSPQDQTQQVLVTNNVR